MHKLVAEPSESLHIQRTDSDGQQRKSRPARRWLQLTLIVADVAVLAAVVLFAVKWPFTRSKVIAELEGATQGKIQIGKFHQTYFPPGCVAENVSLTRYGNQPGATPVTVRKLTIQGSLRGLFTKHVQVFRMDGMHVVARRPDFLAEWAQNKSNSKVRVDEYVITASVLEVERGADKPPLKFEVAELALRPGTNGATHFEAALRNPEPPGELHVSGNVGPWRKDNPAQTPISGAYSFTHADLGVFHGIAGLLASDGSFQGLVQQLEVRGKTGMRDFEVTRAAHKIGLATQFDARVNGRNGDVELKQVIARLGGSGIDSQGSVAGTPGRKGKTASLELVVPNGRIQDFLFLFLKDPVAPMTGKFSFKGHATLPPEKEPFLHKVELQGDFGIDAARLSNPRTQTNLEELSERAEGEKDEAPEKVVSDLKGHVVLRNGIATFYNLSFKAPGAKAKLHGTYSLITHQIDLHGKLSMLAKLHQATFGVKSFLLKIINPILKKNHRGGAVVALSVTGIYPHPIYKTAPIADPI
jgi:AsmA-like C-terminal region